METSTGQPYGIDPIRSDDPSDAVTGASEPSDFFLLFDKCKALRDILSFEAGVQLRPYQLRLSDLIIYECLRRRGAEIAVLQARQSGKTEANALTLLTLSVFFPSVLKQSYSIGIFAPAESQSIHVARRRFHDRFSSVRRFLEGLGVVADLGGNAYYTSLITLNDISSGTGSRLRLFSGAPGGMIIGETLDVALIEQVEDLDPVKITNDIYPMLSTTGGVSILSGTPSLEVKNTYFYNIMTRPDLQRPPQGTNPNGATVFTVDWREAAKYSLTYRDFVQLQAERLGPDSDVFRAVYNIEWIVLRNKFISIEELRQLEEPLFVPEPSFSCYVGWDPARGADRSVATCVYRDQKLFHHVVEWREMEGVDWESQLRVDILPFLKARSPRRLLIDSTRDDPVVEYAQRYAREMRLNVSIEGFKYTSESKDAIGKVLDTEMHQKRVFFPVDSSQKRELSHFREDFLGLERNYKGNILNLDHPSTQGAHNDYCTSLELALWASLRKEFKATMTYTDII